MKKQLLFSLLFVLVSGFLYPHTGEVIKSFDTPGDFPTGLTYDGENLWVADRKTETIYCINPADGKVLKQISSPGYWPMGLAWDGEYLWNADVKGGLPLSENYDGKIYQMDPESGDIINTVMAPGSTPRGLTWDGKYLWCVDNRNDELIQFSPDDGTTIKTLRAPGNDCRGICFDGKYLWVSDRIHDEIYMVEPNTGDVLIVFSSPGPFPRGVAYDGKSLWTVDYQDDKIYKMKIRDSKKFNLSNEVVSEVTFNHKIINFGPGEVLTADVYFGIPVNRPNQEIIGEPEFIPDPASFNTDKWGLETAYFKYINLKPLESATTEMKVKVKTYEVSYFIYPDMVGSLDDIPSGINDKFLENHEKYQYDHPVIQNALKEAVSDEKNPYWIARNIYDYLMDKMYYEMAGGWNTAPTVLDRGNGSCSEYSFVYIAMCRAAGLPARYVGSVVIRGDYASLDDVYHRWVEVYLPNFGWIPVDPSGGDRESPRMQAKYFGHLANRFLITTESGGGSETMTWTYNSNEFYTTEPKTNVVIDHFAEWEPVEE